MSYETLGQEPYSEQHRTVEFEPESVPWVDREDFEAELECRLAAGRLNGEDTERLRHFRNKGYLPFSGLFEPTRVDELVAEYERAWSERLPLEILVEGKGVVSLADLPPRHQLGHHHYRLNDIQEESEPIRRAILHPEIVGFLKLYFDDTPVAMQSLFFEYGSEQRSHQDYPYVKSGILSHLVGCWIAFDDVTADNGPLFYYPGSQRLPKFDWGGGSLSFDGKDEEKVDQFTRFLEQSSAEANLERETFHARRGDVFLWHGALVHGGSPATDPKATRRSLVTHFSSKAAYPRDRRFPEIEPNVYERHGGQIYQRPQSYPIGLLARLGRRVKRLLRGTLRV